MEKTDVQAVATKFNIIKEIRNVLQLLKLTSDDNKNSNDDDDASPDINIRDIESYNELQLGYIFNR